LCISGKESFGEKIFDVLDDGKKSTLNEKFSWDWTVAETTAVVERAVEKND